MPSQACTQGLQGLGERTLLIFPVRLGDRADPGISWHESWTCQDHFQQRGQRKKQQLAAITFLRRLPRILRDTSQLWLCGETVNKWPMTASGSDGRVSAGHGAQGQLRDLRG